MEKKLFGQLIGSIREAGQIARGQAKLTGTRPQKLRKAAQGPVVLRTREEAAAYIAKHAKPTRRGPKGRLIYDCADLKKLDVQYPDQKD